MQSTEDPNELPHAIGEALACWHALRTLGFSADDIYVNYSSEDHNVGVSIKQDDKVFHLFRTGSLPEESTYDQFVDLWTMVGVKTNTGSYKKAHLERLLQESNFYQNKVTIVTKMLAAGIVLPCTRKGAASGPEV